MKKILIKISRALQAVLMAPINLPAKALNIIKYIALGLGVVETVLEGKDEKEPEEPPELTGEMLVKKNQFSESDLGSVQKEIELTNTVSKGVVIKKKITDREEEVDEME